MSLIQLLKKELPGVFEMVPYYRLTKHAPRIEDKLKTVCEQQRLIYEDKDFNDTGEGIGILSHCFKHTRTT
jgi:hypothetical protein